jgi:hypothetical protein
MKEINKRQWSRFCRNIVGRYQFARTKIMRIDPDGTETLATNDAALLDVLLKHKKGKISAIEAKLGQIRNGSPAVSLAMLGAPVKILYGPSDDNDAEIIEVYNEDGHKMIFRIARHSIEQAYDSFVNEMAYTLAEARGFVPGHEQEDWFMAERLIRKVAPISD